MGVAIESWRAAIGTFNGGRSGILSNVKLDSNRSSSECTIVGLMFIFLLMAPFLIHVRSLHQGWSPRAESSACFSTPPSRLSGSSCIPSTQSVCLSTSSSTTSRLFWLSSKDRNRVQRSVNGNRQNRGIRIAHWNAGSEHLKNKMNELEYAVGEHHPHIFGISESNLHRGHDLEDVQLQDYELVTSKTMENDQLQVSRVVCYLHSSIVGKVRHDLMSDQFSSIWLEVGLPGRTKFLVCQLYREWRYLGQPNRGIYSSTLQEQMRRWVIFLDPWEQALATGKEVLVLGDTNLDHLKGTVSPRENI